MKLYSGNHINFHMDCLIFPLNLWGNREIPNLTTFSQSTYLISTGFKYFPNLTKL